MLDHATFKSQAGEGLFRSDFSSRIAITETITNKELLSELAGIHVNKIDGAK